MKKRPCPFCSGEHEHSEDDGCCFCDYTGFVYDEVPEDIGGNITQLQTSEAVFKTNYYVSILEDRNTFYMVKICTFFWAQLYRIWVP